MIALSSFDCRTESSDSQSARGLQVTAGKVCQALQNFPAQLGGYALLFALTAALHDSLLLSPVLGQTRDISPTDTAEQTGDRNFSFVRDVTPLLTRAGCNAGACHGAAAGRGGFRLSLFGSRPEFDYRQLTRARGGRRVNWVEPSLSLVIRKPLGELPHEGGVRFEPDSLEHRLLTQWIAAGAPWGNNSPLARLEVSRVTAPAATGELADSPQKATGESASQAERAPIELRAFAHFADGEVREVTRWALWTSTDPGRLSIELAHDAKSPARLQVNSPGRHHVLVSYLSAQQVFTMTQPYSQIHTNDAPREPQNFIDRQVEQTLTDLGLAPEERAPPATLLRRVTLGLTGRLPTEDQVASFELACEATNPAAEQDSSYEQLVDRLIQSPEADAYWLYQLKQAWRVSGERLEVEAVRAIERWLQAGIAEDRSLAELAEEMLTATGDTHRDGAAAVHRLSPDARAAAEYVSEVLLGVRLRCANCHDHPLDRWTQDDYHGLAAIFATLRRGREVTTFPRGEVTHPGTGEAAVPQLPGARRLTATDPPPREALAKWLLTEPDQLFAKVTVNRVWKALFGRGLVEPVDDLRTSNPATHPDLLEELASFFIAHDYRLRPLLRQIVLSETYRRDSAAAIASVSDEQETRHRLRHEYLAVFPGYTLPPAVLLDAIGDVTGVPAELPEASRSRAVELLDPRADVPALDRLGRCPIGESCGEAATSTELTLPAVLHLVNGELINARLQADEGRLASYLKQDMSTAEMVTRFYRLAWSRSPTPAEAQHWQQQLGSLRGKARQSAFEDWLWSLLNSQAFRRNQ